MKPKDQKVDRVKTSWLFVLGVLVVTGLIAPVAPGQYYAYVTNPGDWAEGVKGDVSVIDLATNTVVATVPVGGYCQGVAINPAGTAVYTANSSSNEFTVIDAATYEAVTLPAGSTACGVTVHPSGRYIYVANPNFNQDGVSNVMVIDRATNQIIDRIDCGGGSCLVALQPDGSVGYVTNVWDGTLAVFDTRTHKVLDTISLKPIGADEISFPVPIVVHPEGTYVYVANRVGPTVWVINTVTHEVMAVASGYAHVGLGINPAGTALYVPDFHDFDDPSLPAVGTTVDVLDTKTLQRITTIEGLNVPLDVSVHPDGTRVYVTNLGNNTVSVHDATTYVVLATIPVGNHPHGCGDFIGPGVPRLLLENAVARLQAVWRAVEGGAEGVNSPLFAKEYLETACSSGDACLQANLWLRTAGGDLDPRRLDGAKGGEIFVSEQTMVEAILNAVWGGWIVDNGLQAELFAIVDEIIQADRVLAAVVIDDAILARVDPAVLDTTQAIVDQGNALAKEARVWQQIEKKASLLHDAIDRYREAWKASQ